MAVPLIPLIALISLVISAFYKLVIYPVFFSPLSPIPNAHWSAPFSRLWILSYRLVSRDTFAVHAAHQRKGPIIRLGPNEISVNSVDGGIRTVYAGGYEKGDWYLNVFSNYGVMPMFAMPEHGPHSKRKRMLSNIYAKSTLQSSRSLAASSRIMLHDRLLPRLKACAAKGQGVEWYEIMGAVTMDFVNAYVFGLKNGSDFIREPQHCAKFLRDYKGRQGFEFWPQELPSFTKWMSKIGLSGLLVPQWVNKANQDIETWVLSMCDSAEKTLNEAEEKDVIDASENYPNVYAHLRAALLKDASKTDFDMSVSQVVADQRIEIASEMLDHCMAGFDTSNITLTFLTWELSLQHNKPWQDRLRAEILDLGSDASPKDIDNAPVLHACLMETLRLHTAIPGNQPRITPANATLGAPGHSLSGLPAGIRVNAQAWSLHRNADVFPQPETWNPDRWLSSSEQQLKEMGRWFWAFGSGGRMCVGSNLAMQEMKALITTVWGNFSTTVVRDDGMKHSGGYVAGPLGEGDQYLMLKLESLK